MTDTISARDANHHFARFLNEVEAGNDFVVTRNGVPVARIVPERLADGRRRLTSEQEEALASSMAMLRQGWPLGIEKLDRNSIYDDVLGINEPDRS
ncbi:MAG: type II toxin-antitoxin system prevent-host-death family antitoxin [Pseudomonadota bacterium]|nr:type II toxin-antitoxin system prevent-host-death family antitoxin [Pseudomonadota bacterium]